ncbi:MAG: hypothetical protein LDL31_09225, partial [Prosthecobacter sp.]|nr:hypothetical protein [Prosthecobacter sp.]
MITPVATPDGILLCEGEPATADERRLASTQGAAACLCLLATDLLTAELEAPWRWLRELGRAFFTRLCQTLDAASVPALTEAESAALLTSMPPFPGAENVSAPMLADWWQQLGAHVAGLAGKDVPAWLRAACPAWHVVGRVNFHLAENKADTQRPFAFLATFTEKLGAGGQAQHLPLARALQLYAGQKDQTALNALLEPVRLAAEKSALLRGWLETKRLF